VDGKAMRGTRHAAKDGQAVHLYAQLKNLPWRSIPAGDNQRNRGHGREEHRMLQAAIVTAGLAFPHAAQAIRTTRRIRPLCGARTCMTRRSTARMRSWPPITACSWTRRDQKAPG
jgi:hypothetical protein